MPTVRTQWIDKSIQSFLDQDYKNSELIIVNDGSNLDYKSILEKYSNDRIRYYRIDKVSIGETNNFGIKKADGELICTLHDDDIMPNNSISLRVNALKDNEVIWGRSQQLSLQGEIRGLEPVGPPDKERIWKQDYINWTTIMWRKTIHNKIGYFAPFSHNEDWHFEIRFLMECNCTYIEDVVMYYRIHSGQYSAIGREAGITKKEESQMWEEMRRRYNK